MILFEDGRCRGPPHTRPHLMHILSVSSPKRTACCLCRQEIEKILRFLPAKSGRQNVMFSATYPPNIQELAGIALNPQRQVVDTVGEEQTHAAEQVCPACTCLDTPGLYPSTSLTRPS